MFINIDIVNLTEPIQTRFGVPRVMFAGEATHEVYYGTTHSGIFSLFVLIFHIIAFSYSNLAYISGEREAKRLVDSLLPKNE